jgi:multidrug efflux pump subunit AcrA (membrane-fusion protein)
MWKLIDCRNMKYGLVLLVSLGLGTAVDAGDHPSLGITLTIPQRIQETMGLKTTKVESSIIKEKIAVMGRIIQDTEHTIEVFAPQAGQLKECKVRVGDTVKKGQMVCTMAGADTQTLHIHAASDGIIMAQFIEENEKVDTASPIFMLAKITQLLASFDVYEQDLNKLKNGQKVLLSSSAYHQEIFDGRIVFISPKKIRVEVNNEKLLLKPGMFLHGDVLLEDANSHLSVPAVAIQKVEDIHLVFVQSGPESFISTKVEPKLLAQKQALVEGGFKEGDVIVTQGASLLKAKLLEKEIPL